MKSTAAKWTASGGRSTSEKVLQTLQDKHPLPALVLEYRAIAHALSAYVQALPPHVLGDGAIHTLWNPLTATGRIASADPNLQAIANRPLHFEGASELNPRAAFAARPGRVLLAADYGQLELRIMAHVAEDAELRGLFAGGADIHRRVAATWKRKKEEDVTADERNAAKALSYGVLYGRGAPSLADALGVSVNEASSNLSTFLSAFPQLQAWMARTKLKAMKEGAVHTLCGRRRLLDAADDPARAQRQAVNTVMQVLLFLSS